MLVINEPIRREIPYEPGAYIDITRLSWKQMKSARKRQEAEQRAVMRELGEEVLRVVFDAGVDRKDKERALNQFNYHESQFDTELLLGAGIVGWSYDAPVNEDSIAQLDERTAIWIKSEIIALNAPDSEEVSKND